MDNLDKHVANMLNSLHRASAKTVNARRHEAKPLVMGALVWYRRPEGTGGKLDSRWLGPCEILSREGEHSYRIRTGPNTTVQAHRTYLKEYWPDTHSEKSKPMFYHRRTVPTRREVPTELRVKRIIGHAISPDGTMTFLTQKEGELEGEAEYLLPQDFISGSAQQLLEYFAANDLQGVFGLV